MPPHSSSLRYWLALPWLPHSRPLEEAIYAWMGLAQSGDELLRVESGHRSLILGQQSTVRWLALHGSPGRLRELCWRHPSEQHPHHVVQARITIAALPNRVGHVGIELRLESDDGDACASLVEPPSLVRDLLSNFHCEDAQTRLSCRPARMDDTGLDEWLTLVQSENRRLPLVAVWDEGSSDWGRTVADAAAGTALVVRFDESTARQLSVRGLPWSGPAVVAVPPGETELEAGVVLPRAAYTTHKDVRCGVAHWLNRMAVPQPPAAVTALRTLLLGHFNGAGAFDRLPRRLQRCASKANA